MAHEASMKQRRAFGHAVRMAAKKADRLSECRAKRDARAHPELG